MMFYIRWQAARALVWLAFEIAPRGPARDLFIAALDGASRDMMHAVTIARLRQRLSALD